MATAKGHGKKVQSEIEEPEVIEPEGNSLIYLFPFLFLEISITNHHCFIEEPMPTEKAKGGRGKKAQFIDNALEGEQMAQVPTKPSGKKATATQAQTVPSNTGRVTRSKTAANKPGVKNKNKATREEQKNAPNEQPAVSNKHGRQAKVTKAVEPDADEMEVIEEKPKPFAEPQLIITPTSNKADKESLSKTPRAKRAAARNEKRAATPAPRRSTRAKKQAVEHIGDEEEAFAATKKPLTRHKVELTQKVTKTRGKPKGCQVNTKKQMDEELTQVESLEEQDAMEGIMQTPFIHKQIEEQDQVAQTGALEEQDAMEGIRETPFINEQIEEKDAMEGIEETPFINRKIEEQDEVAQVEEGDIMMLEGEYPSAPNIAEEPVRQTSSLAAVECPESPELEMSDVDENEGELEAVPIAHTTSSPHTTGELENPLESPVLSSPTRNTPIPSTPVATGSMSTRTSLGIAAQLSQESVIHTPKPEMNQLDISSSPIVPPYTLSC